MTDSALDAINFVRKSHGREPLPNPGVIQDNPEGHVEPPPLDFSDEALGIDDNEEERTPLAPEAEPSPLVRLNITPEEPPKTEPKVLDQPMPVLFVNDGIAGYRGRAIELSGEDQAKIARVLLEAAERALRTELAKIRQEAPRRRNKVAEPAPAAQPEKRKRGRPRKVKPDA